MTPFLHMRTRHKRTTPPSPDCLTAPFPSCPAEQTIADSTSSAARSFLAMSGGLATARVMPSW
jgi:hypothetical protein